MFSMEYEDEGTTGQDMRMRFNLFYYSLFAFFSFVRTSDSMYTLSVSVYRHHHSRIWEYDIFFFSGWYEHFVANAKITYSIFQLES